MAQLVTAYSLPYAVGLHPAPLLSAAQRVLLTVRLRTPPSAEAVEDLDSLVTVFHLLAMAGALGGDTVAPWDSGLADCTDAVATGDSVRWELDGCAMDERAAVVLAQLFLLAHAHSPLASVEVRREGSAAGLVPLAGDPAVDDPYPPLWPQAPFAVTVADAFGDGPTLYVTFGRALTADDEEAIEGEILAWAGAAAVGAYPVAPVEPERCTVVADESVTFVDDGLEWSMTRFRAHPSALAGLVNACMAIHHRIAPITELRLE